VYGNGARLENGYLVLSQLGRITVRWPRPIAGTIKTVTVSKEADGWYVCCSCTEVPVEPLPLMGKEPGIDVGLTVFLITVDGDIGANPRHFCTAERAAKKAQRRVSRRTKGQQQTCEGGSPVRSEASARALSAPRRSPQGGAPAGAYPRHHLRGGHWRRQRESPSRTAAGCKRHRRLCAH
jgi:hypothetical protein